MQKRNLTVAKPSSKAAKAAKPAKPATVKPAAEPVSSVIPGAIAAPITEPAKPAAHITRTAATIARGATNFGTLSDRDSAYLAFYASFAKADKAGTVTLSAIVESGRKPAYNGSAKPHDAGVVNRLAKAGIVAKAPDGHSFTFTDTGKARREYAAG